MPLLNPKSTDTFAQLKILVRSGKLPTISENHLLSVNPTFTMTHTHSQTNKCTHNERGSSGVNHALACLDFSNSKVVCLSQEILAKLRSISIRCCLSKNAKLFKAQKRMSILDTFLFATYLIFSILSGCASNSLKQIRMISLNGI